MQSRIAYSVVGWWYIPLKEHACVFALTLWKTLERPLSRMSSTDADYMHPFAPLQSTLTRLGLTLGFARNSPLWFILPCLVVPVLYLGPLYVSWLCETLPTQRRWSVRGSLLPLVSTWVGIRNYIVVRVPSMRCP